MELDTDTADAAPISSRDPAHAPFPVVGVGASAGGLDALEHFFASVPTDCGMAFVVVTHMQPGRPSLLPQLLSRHTTMAIVPLDDDMTVPVERNTIYIAPGGKYVAITDNVLHLVAMTD